MGCQGVGRGMLGALAVALVCLSFLPPAAGARESGRQEAEIQFSKGLYALNAGDAHEARQRFAAAAEASPSDARYHLYLGLADNRLGRHERARGSLDRARRLDPTLPSLPYERGLAAMGLGQWDLARDHLESARRRQPRRGEVYLRLAVVEDRRGESSTAMSLYEKALALDPSLREQVAFYRGRTYLGTGMVDRARSDFKTAARSEDARITRLSQDYLGRIEVAEAGPPERWDFTGWFAVAYDDNVVLNPEDPGVLAVSDQEDVRAVAYAGVRFRPWVGRRGLLGLGLAAYQSLHEDLEEFDLRGLLPEIEYRFHDGPFFLRAVARYDDYQLDNEDYRASGDLEVRPGWRQGTSGRTEMLVRFRDEDFSVDERDSEEWTLGVEQTIHPWTNKRRTASVALAWTDHDAGEDFERVERALEAAFFTPLCGGWDLHASLEYTDFDYENVHSFFDEVRQDEEWSLLLRTSYDINSWLALVLEYRATEHRSNIAFFDYDRQIVTVGILARP